MNLACQKCLGNLPKVLGIGVTPSPFWEKFPKNTVFLKWIPPLAMASQPLPQYQPKQIHTKMLLLPQLSNLCHQLAKKHNNFKKSMSCVEGCTSIWYKASLETIETSKQSKTRQNQSVFVSFFFNLLRNLIIWRKRQLVWKAAHQYDTKHLLRQLRRAAINLRDFSELFFPPRFTKTTFPIAHCVRPQSKKQKNHGLQKLPPFLFKRSLKGRDLRGFSN